MLRSSFSIYSLLNQFFQKTEQIQKVKAGSVLFQEKDSVEYVYLLLSGTVISWESPFTRERFYFKNFKREELIVEYQLFKHNPHYQFYAKDTC